MSREGKVRVEGGMMAGAVARAAGAAAEAAAGAARGVAGVAGADAGAGAVGADAAGADTSGAPNAGAAGADAASAGATSARRFRITFDGARCVKCWACEVTCRQWSGIPADRPSRRRVREVTSGTFPQVRRTFVSEGCRHCADAPCVAACAAGALAQRADGRVTLDAARCVGCRACARACAFDVPRFAGGVMDKCDGCWSAGVPDGATPHCVATCPTGALGFESVPAGAPEAAVGDGVARTAAPASEGEGAEAAEGAPAQPGARACSPSAACTSAAEGAAAERGGVPAANAPSAQPGAAAPAPVDPAQLADACSLLAALVMREAPAGLLAALRDDPDAAPATLVPYARSLTGADLGQEAEALAVDFATVLLGMSPHPVFPYESTYADTDRLLMRPVRDEVVAAYAAAGFAADPALRLPEDHLAFELAFVAHLARREAAARAAGDAPSARQAGAQRAAFARDHLAWVPCFAADWQRASASPFYRAVARLLAETAHLAAAPANG